jgi:hypothetical protein
VGSILAETCPALVGDNTWYVIPRFSSSRSLEVGKEGRRKNEMKKELIKAIQPT